MSPAPPAPPTWRRGWPPCRSTVRTVRIVPGLTRDGSRRRAGGDARRGDADRRRARRVGADEPLPACRAATPNGSTSSDGRIAGFTTHLTGEAFAALRAPHDPRPHDAGRADRRRRLPPRRGARRRRHGGLLHHLFGVRTLGLFEHLPETEAASYLSGLLIGHEVAAAAPGGDRAPDRRRRSVQPLCASPSTYYGAEARIAGAGRGGARPGRHRGACCMDLSSLLAACPLVAILRGIRPDEAEAIGAGAVRCRARASSRCR